jgi:hypothetical protein
MRSEQLKTTDAKKEKRGRANDSRSFSASGNRNLAAGEFSFSVLLVEVVEVEEEEGEEGDKGEDGEEEASTEVEEEDDEEEEGEEGEDMDEDDDEDVVVVDGKVESG